MSRDPDENRGETNTSPNPQKSCVWALIAIMLEALVSELVLCAALRDKNCIPDRIPALIGIGIPSRAESYLFRSCSKSERRSSKFWAHDVRVQMYTDQVKHYDHVVNLHWTVCNCDEPSMMTENTTGSLQSY